MNIINPKMGLLSAVVRSVARDTIAHGCWCLRERSYTGFMQMQWRRQDLWSISMP